ncbi:MAG: hypothetical protein AB7S26_20410 [Sandaracinaceae bacterium]
MQAFASRRAALFLTLAGCLAILAVVPTGRAQTESVPPVLGGSWRLEGSDEAAMRTVIAAFQPTIDGLPEIVHGFARDRLRSSMQPPRSVQVSVEGSSVSVRLTSDHVTTVEGTLGRRARARGVEDGTVVSTRLSGGWLQVHYSSDQAEMYQLFSTEADGSRMHLDHTLTGPRITGTVRYRIEYARGQSGHGASGD